MSTTVAPTKTIVIIAGNDVEITRFKTSGDHPRRAHNKSYDLRYISSGNMRRIERILKGKQWESGVEFACGQVRGYWIERMK